MNATTIYVNTEVGIRAEYPQNWLIDNQGNYIFRVRNISELGYPTTIQVAVEPVSQDTTARYIYDALTLHRSQTLSSYNVLSSGVAYCLPDETTATVMNYTFAASENAPFLASIPVVVQGQDILAIRRGQAIIVSFLSRPSILTAITPFSSDLLTAWNFKDASPSHYLSHPLFNPLSQCF